MLHLTLPDDTQHPLPFYLAMEEVAACRFDDECFFTWVVEPTVIVGRNQVVQNEVNIPYCHAHGIQVVRRKSGGGCVYADEGNIMMSYITPLHGDTVEKVFARYLQKAAGALSSLAPLNALPSVEVSVSGRNDILLSGRKISGSALYVTPDKRYAIAHGTLLHSTDIERMVSAITPPAEKLAKNGVQSVRQRVTNLTDHISITIPDLRQHLASTLCEKELRLDESFVHEAERIMQDYQKY